MSIRFKPLSPEPLSPEPLSPKPLSPKPLSPKPLGLLLCAALLPLALHTPVAGAAKKQAQPRLTPANSALYIANVGDGTILRCAGSSGKVLSVLGGSLNPVGLAFGPDHNLYVTSYGDGTVVRFNPLTGASLGTFIPRGSGGMTTPVTLAFGPDGNLYVVTGDNRTGEIRRYNGKTSAPLGVFVPNGRGGLSAPGDVAFGPDGNLYVTNNSKDSVLRFSGKTGAAMGAFVKPHSGGLRNPQNLVFGPDGSLYVGGASGVLQYSGKTSQFVRVFAFPSDHLSNVGGLTFGPGGDLYVSDFQMSDVLRYDGKTAAYRGVFVKPSAGLVSNRYILFGPRGGGGLSPAVAAALRAKRLKTAQASEAAAEASRPPLLTAGTPAPDFTVQNKAGAPVKLSDYRGKVVVLDFWSTWCGPCQQSLPHTNSVAKKFAGKGVVVLAVNVWDTKEAFDGWLPQHPEYSALKFALDPAGRGPDSIATKLYHVSGIPTQYVIDKNGRIVKSFVGYGGPTPELAAAITKASAAPAETAKASL